MNFKEYTAFILDISRKYKIDKKTKPFIYALGLGEECGEVQGLFERYFQDEKIDRALFIKELGDVLAYLTLCASLFDADLDKVSTFHKEHLFDDKTKPFIYPLRLGKNCGEVQGLLKKYFRDGKIDRNVFLKKLGDVLAYLTLCASLFDSDLDEVADLNKEKLLGRVERNTLHGCGDER